MRYLYITINYLQVCMRGFRIIRTGFVGLIGGGEPERGIVGYREDLPNICIQSLLAYIILSIETVLASSSMV